MILFLSGCFLLKRYNIDCKEVKSIEIELVHIEDASIPRKNRVLTNQDSLITIIRKYVNKSHKASILKARLKYRVGIHYTNSSEVTWIGVTDQYIKTDKGWFKMRHNLEEYLNDKN